MPFIFKDCFPFLSPERCSVVWWMFRVKVLWQVSSLLRHPRIWGQLRPRWELQPPREYRHPHRIVLLCRRFRCEGMRSNVQTGWEELLLTLTPLTLLSSLQSSLSLMLMQDHNNENNGHLMNNVSRAGTWCGYSVIYGVGIPRGQQRIGWKHFWVNIHSICKKKWNLC